MWYPQRAQKSPHSLGGNIYDLFLAFRQSFWVQKYAHGASTSYYAGEAFVLYNLPFWGVFSCLNTRPIV